MPVLSQKTRYALKAILELASLPPGAKLRAAEIAERQHIPNKFLETILVELKRGGLVSGYRGRGGGYQLGQSAASISFGQVVRLMEGPLALLPCVSRTQYRPCADCSDEQTCPLRRVFREVRDSTAQILDEQMVADVITANKATKGRRKAKSAAKTG
jgi:Rrf2 family protein